MLYEFSFPMRSPTECCWRTKFLWSACFRKYILHYRHCHIFGQKQKHSRHILWSDLCTGCNIWSLSFLVLSCGIAYWRQPLSWSRGSLVNIDYL